MTPRPSNPVAAHPSRVPLLARPAVPLEYVGGSCFQAIVMCQTLLSKPAVAPKLIGFIFFTALVISTPTMTTAEDVVVLAAGPNRNAQTRIAGEVLDYDGAKLVMRLASGEEREFPSDQVLEVLPERSPSHQAADEALAKHDYETALALYRELKNKEIRRWFRQLLIANMVECYQNLGQLEVAGETFLLLVADNPNTPYFDRIPLAWAPTEPSPQLAQHARAWLRRDDVPAAVLLGASHLMSSNDRPAVLGRLERLELHHDPQISMLARAQSWRADVASATEDDLQQWQQVIESAPESLRAGPYSVLGQAYSQQQEPTRAALALLRVPINHPQDRELAARCLFQAAELLQRTGQNDDAYQLYRELTEDYADRAWAGPAARRIESLQDKKQ